MSHLSYSKGFQGVAEVFLRDAKRYAPLLQFIESVMVGDSELTKAERESHRRPCFQAERLRFLFGGAQVDPGGSEHRRGNDRGNRGRSGVICFQRQDSARSCASPTN